MAARNFPIKPLMVTLGLMAGMLSLVLSAPALGQVVIYSTGFEADDGGYTHAGQADPWQWGVPDPTFTRGPATAHSGTKCWGTNLAGDVGYDTDASLYAPAITVPALGANQVARVRFFAWIAVDEMHDRGEFAVSSDGLTWETKVELLHVMQGGWAEYYFDISSYAGGSVYLRWRLYTDDVDYFEQTPYNMAGLYVDDVMIAIADAPPCRISMTLEAWEDQGAYASCPWAYAWNGSEFVRENDVYSTARGPQMEFRDFYTFNNRLVEADGAYRVDLRETERESSFTDLVQLITVDHPPGVKIAADEAGNVLTYMDPSPPVSALDNEGNDVLAAVSAQDGLGYEGFHQHYVTLDFGNLDTTLGATLVMRVKGFQAGPGGAGLPTYARPAIEIQTPDAQGNWVTRNTFIPRWEFATGAYDLSGRLTADKRVRLSVSSCNVGKYHLIDYVGLDTSAQVPTTVNVITPASAIHQILGDVTAAVLAADNVYANMSTRQRISLVFPAPAHQGTERDFVLVTEGYYVPTGTYFVYTWDGEQWVQRDGWSVEGDGDQTRTFDLSLWLPDPDGEYKVRIWQDYWYEPAGIDYVGLDCCSTAGEMTYANDLYYNTSVLNLLIGSDDYRDEWNSTIPYRTRWVEVGWTGCPVNQPPTTDPVTIAGAGGCNPTIGWTYEDGDQDPQAQYEVEVWTGPGGTGEQIWGPDPCEGTASSVVYCGPDLVYHQTYYARVKAFDGQSWGAWSEASWVSGCGSVICNAGGPYSVACGGLATSIALVGSGSYGPPGSTLTYAWTTDCPGGTFDNAASATPTLTIPRNGACGLQCKVHLTATIGEEGVAECVADVTIADECSPAMVFLPGCPGDMSVEAADETGLVVEFSVPEVSGGCNPAVTTSPASGSTFPIGDTQVTITATDDSGIVLTCSFTVTVLPPAQPEAQPTPGQFHGCILFLFQSLFGIPLCGPCFVIGLVGTLVGLVDMKRRVRRWRR